MKNFFLTIILSLSTLVAFAQKSSGTIRDDDENSKNVKALNKDYSENKFILWESLMADDAVIYVNNNKLPKVVVLEAFKGHHAIFNDIQIENSYVHTNYFKSKDVWSNHWFTWMGTGNKTGMRYANKSHFDFKWENGKIVEMQAYFDTKSLENELAAQEEME